MMLRLWWYRHTASFERVGTSVSRALIRLRPNAFVLLLAALVGLGAGIAAVGFAVMLSFSHDVFFKALAWVQSNYANLRCFLVLVLAIGGVITVLLF